VVRGVIGLDIGTTAVRAAQVAVRKTPALLERIEEVPLPIGAVVDGRVADPATVAEALRLLWRKGRFSSRQVRLGVANPWVVTQLVHLPALSAKSLRGGLRHHLADQIPLRLSDVELDCIALAEYTTPEGRRRLRALAVTADRGMLGDLLAAVRLAKLVPVGVDLAPMALLRALQSGNTGDLLVDVGAHGTSLLVRDAGMPVYVRLLPVGGDQVTRALVDRLGLAPETAEAAKHALVPGWSAAGTGSWSPRVPARLPAQAGWPLPGGGSTESPTATQRPARWAQMPAAVSPEHVDRVVDETVIRIVEQVKAALDDYTAGADAVPVERVLLTGGASRCVGIGRWLQSATALPVQSARPLGTLSVGRRLRPNLARLDELEAVAAVPVGLALVDGR
jgi:type IV pilus assembly protein PilM